MGQLARIDSASGYISGNSRARALRSEECEVQTNRDDRTSCRGPKTLGHKPDLSRGSREWDPNS